MTTPIEFWYEFASTYSYVAAHRVEALGERAGIEVRWRPFLLGPMFARQGWTTSPFNLYPDKGKYMWRDLERICAAEGLPWHRPSVMPRGSILAARIALVLPDGPRRAAFSRAVFDANFAQDRDIGARETIVDVLTALGEPAETLIHQSAEPEIKSALREATEDAMKRGIFGAPSFTVGTELFWGNDRLEQAVAWAKAPGL